MASAQGWLRFWCIDHRGGLLGQFNGAHNPGENCGAMCTDEENEVLITGDTNGYIKVWDYCIYRVKSIIALETIGRLRSDNLSLQVLYLVL